jgi:hypothetical protein
MTITNIPAPYGELTWFLEKGTLNAQFRDRNRIETLDSTWSSRLGPNDPPEFQTDRGITFRSRRAVVEAALAVLCKSVYFKLGGSPGALF